MTRIGFIGLGGMGAPMAANLVKAGCRVTATDLSIGAIDRAVEAGCARGNTVAATVKDAEVVITMLPAGAHVRSVYTDNYGVIAHARPGALFIDASTIDAEVVCTVLETARDRGFAMVSAPVSGDAAAARTGALTFTVSGDRDAYQRARPVLQMMGARVIYAGEARQGQAAMRQSSEAQQP